MKYCKFGNTDVKISMLGFGCMRFPENKIDEEHYEVDQEKVNEMIKFAYKNGVNYFDTAFYYCHSNSEESLGIAVKDFREKVYISTKCPISDCKEKSDFRKFLNESLKRLNTNYIDFYHFWAISKDKFDHIIMKLDLLQEALDCKKEGLIKHISFSFHDDPENIKYIIDQGKIFETLLVQYNLLNRDHEEMIEYARNKGLGVVVMGPVAGGKLSCPSEFARKILNSSAEKTYELAFKFVLSNKNVCCALSGMEKLSEVKNNINCINAHKSLEDEEIKQINQSLNYLNKLKDLYCTNCRYCISCPKNINIGQIFNAYTYYQVYDLKETAIRLYKEYKNSNQGQIEDCIECQLCENKCPQKIKIVEDLKKVKILFDGLI